MLLHAWYFQVINELYGNCNNLSSVGSGNLCSICTKRMPERYTFNVLYETHCEMSAQKYCSVREDAGSAGILKPEQNKEKALSAD